MRGIVALTLTGLGAFFVALAALLHFFVAGQAVKFPLNQFNQTTFSGSDVSYFYLKQLDDVTDVKVQATQFLEGDVEAGSSSTAVWEESTTIQDLTNFRNINSTARRSAFNRTTGALVNCCGEFVGGNTSVNQSGQGFMWPIGTQKQTYDVFDPITLHPEPFVYTGTSNVDGRLTYEFVEKVANQQFGTRTLPAFLVGGSGQSTVSAPEFVSETTTVFVDPGSGIPVYEVQSQTQTIQSAGTIQLVLYQGTLTETPASASAAVAMAASFDLRKQLLQDILPLVSVLVGLAMLIVGIALTGRRRGAELSGYESEASAGLPQGYVESDYPPGLLDNVFPQRHAVAGNPPAPPQNGARWLPEAAGYQQGEAAEASSWPGYSGNGHQAEYPETGPLALPANGYHQQEQFQQPGYQSGQFQQPGYQSGQFQQGDYQSGQFQQGDYRSGQFQQGDYQSGQFQQPDYDSGQFRQPNHQSPVPQNGYEPGQAQGNGYWTGFGDNGYAAEPPETDYPTGPPQDVYQTDQFPEVNGTPEFPGRGSDGDPWILEPRPEQPRVGRHSRGGRDGAPGR